MNTCPKCGAPWCCLRREDYGHGIEIHENEFVCGTTVNVHKGETEESDGCFFRQRNLLASALTDIVLAFGRPSSPGHGLAVSLSVDRARDLLAKVKPENLFQ